VCVCEMYIYICVRGPCKGNEFLRHESFPCAPLPPPPRRITCVEGVIAVRPLSIHNMHAHTHPRPATDDNTTRRPLLHIPPTKGLARIGNQSRVMTRVRLKVIFITYCNILLYTIYIIILYIVVFRCLSEHHENTDISSRGLSTPIITLVYQVETYFSRAVVI